ncbi:hypothetical protein COOONC_09916 [Cooperia oncophora]
MSDRLPDIHTKLEQNDDVDKTGASLIRTNFDDYSMYEVDEKQHNTTCPPDLLGFDVNLLRNLSAQDAYLREQLNSCVKSALASQDPCTLADDEREEKMRTRQRCVSRTVVPRHAATVKIVVSLMVSMSFVFLLSLAVVVIPYKSLLCDKFSNTGYCKYGARCQFIHKITNPAILAQQMLARENALRAQAVFNPQHTLDSSCYPQGRRLVDMNVSMPIDMINHRSDVDRAFARTAGSQNVASIARTIENRHAYLSVACSGSTIAFVVFENDNFTTTASLPHLRGTAFWLQLFTFIATSTGSREKCIWETAYSALIRRLKTSPYWVQRYSQQVFYE